MATATDDAMDHLGLPLMSGCRYEGSTHWSGCDCNEATWAARLAAAEARCAELQGALSAEASLSVRVGMRREFEEILGVSDTMEPGAFEVGVARLRRLIAAEARCESVTKWAAEYHAKWQAAEARCAELQEELRLTLIASHVHADEHQQQRARAARYEEAIQMWREGRAHIGTPMTYVDQRLVDTVRMIIGDV
jgi:hypothetical protein